MVGVLIIPFLAVLATAKMEQLIKYDNMSVQQTAAVRAEGAKPLAGAAFVLLIVEVCFFAQIFRQKAA